jgi:hypothetical protein
MDIGDPVVGTAKATVLTVVKPLDLLLIRDDCYLCMGNTDILSLNPRLRIYHGKVTDSWDTRKKFLDGQEAFKWGQQVRLEPGQVDITRLTTEQLIEFALDHFSLELPADTDYAHALVAVVAARQKAEEEAAKPKVRTPKARPEQNAGIRI